MAEKNDDGIVTFLMPDGTKVSNDPRFRPNEDEGEVQGPPGPGPVSDSNMTGSEADEVNYNEMSAKELKAEVDSRNADRAEEDQIDISGMTKKSQLVKALQADDEGDTEG